MQGERQTCSRLVRDRPAPYIEEMRRIGMRKGEVEQMIYVTKTEVLWKPLTMGRGEARERLIKARMMMEMAWERLTAASKETSAAVTGFAQQAQRRP